MKDFFIKLKIPTILGLSIITTGIATGVYLTMREQTFISNASPDVRAQNITISNISDTSVTISWQTSAPTISFITYGMVSPNEQTVLDDKDTKTPQPYLIHYVTIKNLLPKTTYQYKILSGKIQSEESKFTTAAPLSKHSGFNPIIGTVFDKDKPLNEGIVYLSIADATTQSAQVLNSGNFLIPISQIRKMDLSDNFPLTEATLVKLTIVSKDKQTIVIFKLKDANKGLPLIKLGENLDLTGVVGPDKYDLNNDGKINAADNAIILQNVGPLRPPSREAGSEASKNPKADLNEDGTVDQKDLDIMAKQINQ